MEKKTSMAFRSMLFASLAVAGSAIVDNCPASCLAEGAECCKGYGFPCSLGPDMGCRCATECTITSDPTICPDNCTVSTCPDNVLVEGSLIDPWAMGVYVKQAQTAYGQPIWLYQTGSSLSGLTNYYYLWYSLPNAAWAITEKVGQCERASSTSSCTCLSSYTNDFLSGATAMAGPPATNNTRGTWKSIIGNINKILWDPLTVTCTTATSVSLYSVPAAVPSPCARLSVSSADFLDGIWDLQTETNDNAPVYKQANTDITGYMYRYAPTADGWAGIRRWQVGPTVGDSENNYYSIQTAATPYLIPSTAFWTDAAGSYSKPSIVCTTETTTPPPTPKPTIPDGIQGLMTSTFTSTSITADDLATIKSHISEGVFDTPAKCKAKGNYDWYCQLAAGGNYVQSGCGCDAALIAGDGISCDGDNVFPTRARKLTTSTPKTCAKGLVEGGVAEGFMRSPIPPMDKSNPLYGQSGGAMGDGANAPYSWAYTCAGGEMPFHNSTVTGDYQQVQEEWQIQCTQHQIAFQCCTDNCTCHDPVVSAGGGSTAANDDDNAAAVSTTASSAPIGSSGSSTPAIAVSGAVGGCAVLGAVAVAAYRRHQSASQDQHQQLGELLTEDGISSL